MRGPGIPLPKWQGTLREAGLQAQTAIAPLPGPNTRLPLPINRRAGQSLARPWVLPSCPGRPSLPSLSSVLSQGSEEEESCTSEITTSLSEEVLDLRGAERHQKGAHWVCGHGGAGGGVEMVLVHSPGPWEAVSQGGWWTDSLGC